MEEESLMESENEPFLLRNLSEKDLPAFENFWTDELGFDSTVNHIRRWYLVDPEGFFGIFLDHQLVASGSAIKQTGDLYFVGSIGVKTSHRGKGLCKKMFRVLFERCPDENFALFAVPEYVPMYCRLGFKVVEDGTGYVYGGKAAALLRGRTESAFQFEVVDSSKPELIKSLVEYDTRLHGFERHIVTTLIGDVDGSVVACLLEGTVVGFVRIGSHKRDGGAIIGPLYADTAEIAYTLLEDILVRNRAQAKISVFLFVPSQGGFLAEKSSSR